MARWIRFEQVDGTPLLINTDTGDEIRPAMKEDLAVKGDGDYEGYLVAFGLVVKGDIESLTLMLGAETFA